MTEFHVLNGDALKEQFPDSIPGETIVAREALVDGPVSGVSLEEFYATRKRYVAEAYGDKDDFYQTDVRSQFQQILDIPAGSIINLWFEHDLFCQVNLWFVASLIQRRKKAVQVNLIRPTTSLEWGFGGMSPDQLAEAYHEATPLDANHIELFARLWQLYQKGDHAVIVDEAEAFKSELPFVLEAASANLDRFPADGSPGRDYRAVEDAVKRLGSEKFGPVFRAFHKEQAIYGYGDLQVKRIFDEIVSRRTTG